MREREYYFDNIKALLIFLVVWGHVLKKFGSSYEADVIYNIIFSFHMPVFLFVTGYFAKYNPKKVFAKMFPLYILFQTLQYAEVYLTSVVNPEVEDLGRLQFTIPQWTLWYLLSVMIFQLLLPAFDVDDIRRQAGGLALAFALGIAIGFLPDTNNFMAMSRTFVFLPFFLLGYYERKNHFLVDLAKKTYAKAVKVIFTAAGVLICLYFVFYSEDFTSSYFYGKESFNGVESFVWRLLGWGTAFVWLMILLTWMPRRKFGYMAVIGANTLPVYLLHPLIMLMLLQTSLPERIDGNMFGMFALAVVLTFVLSWHKFEVLLEKIRIPMHAKRLAM